MVTIASNPCKWIHQGNNTLASQWNNTHLCQTIINYDQDRAMEGGWVRGKCENQCVICKNQWNLWEQSGGQATQQIMSPHTACNDLSLTLPKIASCISQVWLAILKCYTVLFVSLQMYTLYVGNFDKATETLSTWTKKLPAMAAVIEEIQVSCSFFSCIRLNFPTINN